MTIRRMLAVLALSVSALGVAALAGCGGADDDTLTIYLPQKLGPDGPRGQIAPVLMPVERDRRPRMSAAWQAVLELRVGPSPNERAHGFSEALGPGTRLRRIELAGATATVELAGEEPAFSQSAAIVLSLTEEPSIDVVRLRLDGEPCCFYTHDRGPRVRVTRHAFRGWSGEPCHLRTSPTAVRCRSDR